MVDIKRELLEALEDSVVQDKIYKKVTEKLLRDKGIMGVMSEIKEYVATEIGKDISRSVR